MLARWLDPSDADGSVGRIGKYEVQGVVGQGGMGLVLKAFDTELNRWVALKTLAHHITPQRPAEIDAGLRLAREARAVASLRHPHIISIYGLETWRSVPLIVMPLIDGGTLQQWAATKPLQIEQALATAIQIASALAALHAAGIVHRDLKPSNILLQGDLDHVLISDFGLARIDGDVAITHSNALAGTPFFMSPEQALGKPVDVRSDLFSFGCVLFWMFSGKYPFRGNSNYETLSRLIHTEPNFAELDKRRVPEYLQRLIKRLLAKEAKPALVGFEPSLRIASSRFESFSFAGYSAATRACNCTTSRRAPQACACCFAGPRSAVAARHVGASRVSNGNTLLRGQLRCDE